MQVETSLRVLIAYDSPTIVESLCQFFSKMKGIEVVGSASNGEAVIEMAKHHLPDLLVIDVNMPQVNGLLAADMIHQQQSEIRIIMISIHDDDGTKEDCFKHNADAFVCKIGMQRRLKQEMIRLFPP